MKTFQKKYVLSRDAMCDVIIVIYEAIWTIIDITQHRPCNENIFFPSNIRKLRCIEIDVTS